MTAKLEWVAGVTIEQVVEVRTTRNATLAIFAAVRGPDGAHVVSLDPAARDDQAMRVIGSNGLTANVSPSDMLAAADQLAQAYIGVHASPGRVTTYSVDRLKYLQETWPRQLGVPIGAVEVADRSSGNTAVTYIAAADGLMVQIHERRGKRSLPPEIIGVGDNEDVRSCAVARLQEVAAVAATGLWRRAGAYHLNDAERAAWVEEHCKFLPQEKAEGRFYIPDRAEDVSSELMGM